MPTSWRLHENKELAATYVNRANSLLAETRARLLNSGAAVAANDLSLPDGSKIQILSRLVSPGPPPIEHSVVNIWSPFEKKGEEEEYKKETVEPLCLLVIYQGNKLAAISMDSLSNLENIEKASYYADLTQSTFSSLANTFQIKSNHGGKNSLMCSFFSITPSTDDTAPGIVLTGTDKSYLYVIPSAGDSYQSLQSADDSVALNYNKDHIFTSGGVYFLDDDGVLQTYKDFNSMGLAAHAIDSDGVYYFDAGLRKVLKAHPLQSGAAPYVQVYGIGEAPWSDIFRTSGYTTFDFESETHAVVETPSFPFVYYEKNEDDAVDTLKIGFIANTAYSTAYSYTGRSVKGGNATGESYGKLIDGNGGFTSDLTGYTVINTDTNNSTGITGVDSSSQLSLGNDIMTTGANYQIVKPGTSLAVSELATGGPMIYWLDVPVKNCLTPGMSHESLVTHLVHPEDGAGTENDSFGFTIFGYSKSGFYYLSSSFYFQPYVEKIFEDINECIVIDSSLRIRGYYGDAAFDLNYVFPVGTIRADSIAPCIGKDGIPYYSYFCSTQKNTDHQKYTAGIPSFDSNPWNDYASAILEESSEQTKAESSPKDMASNSPLGVVADTVMNAYMHNSNVKHVIQFFSIDTYARTIEEDALTIPPNSVDNLGGDCWYFAPAYVGCFTPLTPGCSYTKDSDILTFDKTEYHIVLDGNDITPDIERLIGCKADFINLMVMDLSLDFIKTIV